MSSFDPLLHENQAHGMVPPPVTLELAEEPRPRRIRRGAPALPWVRFGLCIAAFGWLAIFAIAFWLNPYTADGQPLREETHRQLGLPPCTFKVATNLPCPSCGMTTSFALLVRGDVINSLRANFAGTALALIGVFYLPWALMSMWHGRWVGVKRVESWLIRIVFGWVALMLLRWGALLIWSRFE